MNTYVQVMKKNELIHLHSLLVEIAGDFVDRGIATRTDLAAYDRLGVGPMALRECRADHEVAVRTLTAALAVCAEHDMDGDHGGVPATHLLSDDESDATTDTRVASR